MSKFQEYKNFKLNPKEIRILHQIAKNSYHDGKKLISDEEFDLFEEEIRNFYLSKNEDDYTQYSGCALKGNEVYLPVMMPSFRKPKNQHELDLCLKNIQDVDEFIIIGKLDGVACLWMSNEEKLFTNKTGFMGTDVSQHSKYIQGLKKVDKKGFIIRGEAMVDKLSDLAKMGADTRNTASGLLNSKNFSTETEITKISQLKFIAFEIVNPKNIKPSEQLELLKNWGFEIPFYMKLKRSEITAENLMRIYDDLLENKNYNFDGVVLYPNVPRNENFSYKISSNGNDVEPLKDRIGWKESSKKELFERKVKEVIWSEPKETKIMVPKVVFEPPIISKIPGSDSEKNYTRVTLHNASYIRDGGIGPGAIIQISIAGQCITKFEKTLEKTEPQFPDEHYEWDEKKLNIYATETSDSEKIDGLAKALSALNVDGIGPKLIEKFFLSGFNTLEKIYLAKAQDFLTLNRVGEKTATNIYNGLRIQQKYWTALNFMLASRAFPRGIAESKMKLVFSISKDWKKWNYEEMKEKSPKGLPSETLKTILDCIPKFRSFYDSFTKIVGEPGGTEIETETEKTKSGRIIVFTGCTAKSLGIEDKLISQGDVLEESVTKKTTHLVYKGTIKESTKTKKAKEYGIQIVEASTI